mgnify:CR=1 FL=1
MSEEKKATRLTLDEIADKVKEKLETNKKEGNMPDEKPISDKDLLIHDFREAQEQWGVRDKELSDTIALLHTQVQEIEEKAKKSQEADAKDWLEHFAHGGCPSNDSNCARGKVVRQVLEKGQASVADMTPIEVNEKVKPKKWLPVDRVVLGRKGGK